MSKLQLEAHVLFVVVYIYAVVVKKNRLYIQ